MERFIQLQTRRLKTVNTQFTRYLYDEIDWNLPLIIVTGSRGTGKTTLLLQYLKSLALPGKEALYISLDDPYFEVHRLWEFGEAFFENGGRVLLLDEVHKYPPWSKDLKYLYDNYPQLKLIATGSSILDLKQGEGDLSRRAVYYHLHGLSFREYLTVTQNVELSAIELSTLLKDHADLSADITDQVSPLTHFSSYMQHGYYPFFLESKSQYLGRLITTINVMIENDIPAFEKVDYQTIRGLKKLLFILSESVPFKPNISKLSERIGTSRNLLLKMLDVLERADLLRLIRTNTKGIGMLAKPDKVLLQNTNLIYALAEVAPNKGQLRETFFSNQVAAKHRLTTPKWGDFMVDDQWVFEVGGSSKTRNQIAGVPNAYLAVDDTKFGSGQRIPLWLFGFLY